MDIFTKCYDFKEADEIKAAGYYFFFRELESAQDTEVVVGGRRLIMAGSNNYLGLTTHPRVKEAAIKAIEKYGSGCAGSRFLNGNLDIIEKFENKLADFFHKDAAVIFATGYQTNLGIISTLVGRNDEVFVDKFDHASIIDGCRFSFGKVVKFRHNDAKDLDRHLSMSGEGGKFVVVDGVFSMEGDITPLPDIIAAAKKHGARIMVDDAHGVGVLGDGGRGTAEHFHMENDVDIIFHPFDPDKKANISIMEKELLLKEVMEEGKITIDTKTPEDIRKYLQIRFKQLPESYKRFLNPDIYKVGISRKLRDLKDTMAKKMNYHESIINS